MIIRICRMCLRSFYYNENEQRENYDLCRECTNKEMQEIIEMYRRRDERNQI